MNLVVDIGNTKVKYAVFGMHDIVIKEESDNLDVSIVLGLCKKYNIEGAIFSSVRNTNFDLIKTQLNNCFVLIASNYMRLPLKINYRTPKTLGFDRIAISVGAYSKEKNDLLVIDIGTAITYERVSAEGIYLGGNISPGPITRAKALNTFTDMLPLVSIDKDFGKIGFDTNSAIQNGIMKGILFEITGYIEEFRRDYPSGSVFFTGGFTKFFDKNLKNSIFVEQNLLLCGLNYILNFNYEKN